MNRIVWAGLIWLALSTIAQAKLKVVASIPDFGSIAQEIGGARIEVTVLTKGTEDAHFADARPSYLRVLNQADLLLEGGVELEMGWLPALLQNARNARILAGGPGNLQLAQGLELLDVPTGPLSRAMGDVHARGNPHYYLDPRNGKIMAARMAQMFEKLDPSGTEVYRANVKRFEVRVDQKMEEWKSKLAPFRGAKMITYHQSFDYFARCFQLEVIGQLEPKPGIEPSPSHINALVQRAKSQQVKLIVIEPFRPRKTAEAVAERLGAKLLILPDRVGGTKEATDFFTRFDYLVVQIETALK